MDIDIIEEQLKESVGIIVFGEIDEELVSVHLRHNGDALTYFGGAKLEGEPDIVAAQRWMRDSFNIDVSTDDLIPFARTSDPYGTCALFATSLPHGEATAMHWALSQLSKFTSEMGLDVPVVIEMAKLAMTFPEEVYFTAEVR